MDFCAFTITPRLAVILLLRLTLEPPALPDFVDVRSSRPAGRTLRGGIELERRPRKRCHTQRRRFILELSEVHLPVLI